MVAIPVRKYVSCGFSNVIKNELDLKVLAFYVDSQAPKCLLTAAKPSGFEPSTVEVKVFQSNAKLAKAGPRVAKISPTFKPDLLPPPVGLLEGNQGKNQATKASDKPDLLLNFCHS